jgi:ribosomal protein S18 acetylase RimI-like enzyme
MPVALLCGGAWRSYFAAMSVAPAQNHPHETVVRAAQPCDVDGLVALETNVFTTDRISRRSFRRFLVSPSAALMVAESDGRLAGYALVLFRDRTHVARLYSIAVAPHMAGRRVGTALLKAAEEGALARGAARLRLEVREGNGAAIGLYRKSGYRPVGRRAHYYEDRAHALRFEKRLMPDAPGLRNAPPYFHQTTEFTCGPACMMMALAWADPNFRPTPALELKLWREATTIFTTSGPGGCDPCGVAVTLRHHGLAPEIHVSQRGPYFLDTVRDEDKRRVMRLAQDGFRHETEALKIPIHVAPLTESALMETFERGGVAIVLVSGYRMVRRNVPHWVFAFGRDGRHVLVHDPAAVRDETGKAVSAETYAIPSSEFDRMTRYGRDDLRAAIVIRKGRLQ